MLKPSLTTDITIETSLDKGIGLIQADQNQIIQVLLNLGLNAKDEMPNGGEIIISSHNIDLSQKSCPEIGTLSPGKYVRIDFTDTGVGIAPKNLPH